VSELIAFLGPSLSRAQALDLVDAELRPPARQGDVFEALRARPRAIALIDGVFEADPSVWHHELLAAHAAGVTVYGAASMGALRASELPGVVIPVGPIAARYVSGQWRDDSHVALLHADAAHGFRGLTEPHVNVVATAEAARRRGVLSPARFKQLLAVSEGQFYQSRTWATVLGALPWPAAQRERLRAFVRAHAVNQKALDAAACLRRLARAPRRRPARASSFSSFVRRSRLVVPKVSPGRRGAAEEAGTRTLLLAAFARAAKLQPDAARVRWWFSALPEAGWADDERAAAAETLALEELVLSAPEYFVSDGPSRVEGLVLELQRRRANQRTTR
jgi:hypothetical protein